MVEELVGRLLIEAAALLAGAALAQLLRWLAARLGLGSGDAHNVPVLRAALLEALPGV